MRYDSRPDHEGWQLQEAKQKFSEVVRRATSDGPQVVTRHGEEVAVVVSAEDYRRLKGEKLEFKDFLLAGPRFDDLDLTRDQRPMREIDLSD
ncbi:MAG: hypothetical protein NVSMB17_08630 [Candidatus Dormibacteria bacterium]